MQKLKFTNSQVDFIRGAVELAGERYRRGAAEFAVLPGHEGLAKAFVRKAEDAAAILAYLGQDDAQGQGDQMKYEGVGNVR